LASSTVDFEQQRLPGKRSQHKPTQVFGKRIDGRGSHIIASNNPPLSAPRLDFEQRQLGDEPINVSSVVPASNVDSVPIVLTGTQKLPEQEQTNTSPVLNGLLIPR